MSAARLPLAGVGVLVTRPLEQAAGLARRLRDLGAEPQVFPALALLPPSDAPALQDDLADLARVDLAVFVSPAAVRWGLAALAPIRDPEQLAARFVAVGKGTAAALRAAGLGDVLAPATGFDSEHLLALPELATLAGQCVLIFRGEGGRAVLGDTLRQRGAEVRYVECYRRGCPSTDPAPVLAAFQAGKLQAVTAFSGETLAHLQALLGADGDAALRATPLFVPHERIAEHARARGFARVITTPPAETGLLAGLVEYFTHD